MDIACSTLVFAQEPLDVALRRIGELDFSRADFALYPGSPQATPEEAASDSAAIVARVRRGPSIGIAALTAEIAGDGEEFFRQLDGVAHLAKQLACVLVTVPAAAIDAPLPAEADRLARVVRACLAHGVVACVPTRLGTLAESPDSARKLCELVPGLGLTLDPTAFVAQNADRGNLDSLFGLVRHVQLRDSGRGHEHRQVAIGRGEIDYSRIVQGLERVRYRGALTAAMDSRIATDIDVPVEARKLGRVLESMLKT